MPGIFNYDPEEWRKAQGLQQASPWGATGLLSSFLTPTPQAPTGGVPMTPYVPVNPGGGGGGNGGGDMGGGDMGGGDEGFGNNPHVGGYDGEEYMPPQMSDSMPGLYDAFSRWNAVYGGGDPNLGGGNLKNITWHKGGDPMFPWLQERLGNMRGDLAGFAPFKSVPTETRDGVSWGQTGPDAPPLNQTPMYSGGGSATYTGSSGGLNQWLAPNGDVFGYGTAGSGSGYSVDHPNYGAGSGPGQDLFGGATAATGLQYDSGGAVDVGPLTDSGGSGGGGGGWDYDEETDTWYRG